MKESKKSSVAQSFRLREDISKKLSNYSEVSHIPKTTIVELALEEYIDKRFPSKMLSREK